MWFAVVCGIMMDPSHLMQRNGPTKQCKDMQRQTKTDKDMQRQLKKTFTYIFFKIMVYNMK